METFPEDPLEMMKARIVSGEERQAVWVCGKSGEGRRGFLLGRNRKLCKNMCKG